MAPCCLEVSLDHHGSIKYKIQARFFKKIDFSFSKMMLENRLQLLKLIIGSYALFLVVVASFVKFTVPVAEKVTIEEAVAEAKTHFLDVLFNDTTVSFKKAKVAKKYS